MVFKKLIYLLFLLLLVSSSYAIIITPIDKETTYEPDKESFKDESCGFNIKGSGESRITFKVAGDLNSSVQLENEYIDVEENKWYTVNCIIKLNSSINPGPHYATILSIENPKSSGDLSAVAGVAFPIKIFVPYPGKYLEIVNFIAKDIEVNKTQEFSIKVISRGSEKLDSVTGNINIIGSIGSVGSVISSPISLVSGEESIIITRWDSIGVPAGQYNAKALIRYDEKSEISETLFRIGDIRIDINDVTHNNIKMDSIAKFNVQLQSYWNKEINDAHVIMTVYDQNNREVANTKGENFIISSWAVITKQIFLDTKDLNIGKYTANFTVVHSSGKSSEKEIEFSVQKNYPITIIVLVVVMILLIIIFIFVVKKLKNEKNK